jgi:hypothetical protein
MPNASYRRKLRTQALEPQIQITQPNYPSISGSTITKIPPPPPVQNCNTVFDSIVSEIHQSVDVLIDLTDYEDVKTRSAKISETLVPYSEYFVILDRVDAYIKTVAALSVDPIDIQAIRTQVELLRAEMRSLPSLCPESDVMAARIAGLITFIEKTVNMETFAYSLKVTLEKIQASIDSFTTVEPRLEEIYRVILEIMQNIKDERPVNTIQWRVRYVKRLVSVLLSGKEELSWAI